MYSKKLFGIHTLTWSVGSMGLCPEWPWRARRKRISCPDGSVQYWNLFLLPPPPAILLFHKSSDQYWEYSNLFRISSFSLSIAPSSSQSNSPCRRRVVSLFDTGWARFDWVPCLISIHVLSRIGRVLEDEQVVESLLGFALSLDRLANANTSVFVSEVSCSLTSYSLSIISVTNLFKPWEILTHEWELSLFTDSILISTPCLPCKLLVVTSNTGPILVFPRIQPFGSDDFSSLGKVYSRQATEPLNCENSFVSFVMKYCPTSTVVKNPASVQILITRSCCDSFSVRSVYLCNWYSSSEGSSFKGMFVLITLGTNNGLDCPFRTGVSPIYRDKIHILHTFLRLPRKDWADLQK